VPAADLVLVQADQALAGLEALLDGPMLPGDPDQGGQRTVSSTAAVCPSGLEATRRYCVANSGEGAAEHGQDEYDEKGVVESVQEGESLAITATSRRHGLRAGVPGSVRQRRCSARAERQLGDLCPQLLRPAVGKVLGAVQEQRLWPQSGPTGVRR
jgi:hypothetical protein